MQTFQTILTLGIAAVAVYFIVQVAMAYKQAQGTGWERLLAAASESASMLWGKAVLVMSGIVAHIGDISTAFNLPEVDSWIKANIGDPKTLAMVMAGIAIVNMWARMRTLGK